MILSIDQSTSSTKALLFSQNGELLDISSRSHRQIYPQPGWVEHDADEIWDNTLSVVRILLEKHPANRELIQFVSITNQRETFVVFDKGTGKPVGNALVWQCTRSIDFCERLKSSDVGNHIKAESGLEIDPYFPASKLMWWMAHDSMLAARLESGEYLWGTIDTYLIYRMTNGIVYATDPTNASRTMLYSLKSREWDVSLCRVFGVNIERLPEIRNCDAVFGETTFEGVFNKPIPIKGVIGDSQAAMFAHYCLSPGSAKVTLGTGSSIVYSTGKNLKISMGGPISALVAIVDRSAIYGLEGIVKYSSAIMDWLQHQLGLFDEIKEADELAKTVGGSDGVYIVPAFGGLGAPYWNASAKAAIVGLTTYTGKAQVIRAGFEAMAFQVRQVLEMIESEVCHNCSLISFDGGPTKSSFLMQLMADVLQREIRVSNVSECSALGAVMAGMFGSGLVDSLQALSQLPHGVSGYKPNKDNQNYTILFDEWKRQVGNINTL